MGRIGQVADINSLSSSQIETQYHCSLYAEYAVYAKGTNSRDYISSLVVDVNNVF